MLTLDDLRAFFERLQRAPASLLMLDYDGTLAPFRAERDQARPYPGVRDLLTLLRDDCRTRLVLITGRATDDLLPLLDLAPTPEIWGSHGWERRRPNGDYTLAPLSPAARAGIAAVSTAMERAQLADHCERKPAGVALHWRGAEPAVARRIRALALRTCDARALDALMLKEFDGGLEVRAIGWDKGAAVRELLSESEAETACAYLGDDLTDEDAFRAIAPRGLGVLVRAETRPSAAGAHLQPPEELIAFLDQWRLRTRKGDGDGR